MQGAAIGAPTVRLTSPANGATFTAPATIAMTANASDPEGQLTRVEFLNGTTVVGSDTTAPYPHPGATCRRGATRCERSAYDAAGASATSAAVTVTVSAASTPPRLVVFTASSDHATNVTSYRFDVFARPANPATATPVATANLGKPTPAANNDITSDQSTLFSSLAAGNYIATVTAVGPGGSTAARRSRSPDRAVRKRLPAEAGPRSLNGRRKSHMSLWLPASAGRLRLSCGRFSRGSPASRGSSRGSSARCW